MPPRQRDVGTVPVVDADNLGDVQKTFNVRWGPPNVGGILEPAAIVATLALAIGVRRRKPAFWFTVGSVIALLLAFPAVFFWLVHPANVDFRQATSSTLPDHWQQLSHQ